jgi:hypothetical protein
MSFVVYGPVANAVMDGMQVVVAASALTVVGMNH